MISSPGCVCLGAVVPGASSTIVWTTSRPGTLKSCRWRSMRRAPTCCACATWSARPVVAISAAIAMIRVVLMWTSDRRGGARRGDLAADRLPDAAEMCVDVAEEDALDQVLYAHRWHPREHGAGLRELSIGEATHGRGRRGGRLLVDCDRVRLRRAGELLGVLGVHVVEHLAVEVRKLLARGDRCDDVGGRLVAAGDMV